jgi:hypothetical protein
MSAAPLPAIEQWLTALVPRVRALRVARGTCRLVAAALGTASAVLLLDAAFGLPAWGRGLFLSVWLTATGVLTWRWVLVPWRGDIPLAEVARELEKQLPELGERLRAAVTDDPKGPSDAVRTAVDEDTARRARGVDRTRAVPLAPAAWLAAGAGVAILAAVATAALVPGSGERLRRVAAPWYRPGAAPFRVIVTSGEPVVRRGGSVTLSAYTERNGRGSNPLEAVLVVTDGPDGSERRVPMTGDGAAFHATLPRVSGTFGYCVEIGGARSEQFTVTVLDPVELADGTRIEIAAPDYAQRPKRVLTAPADFDGFQFGAAGFQLKFTLPAASAHLDWRPDGAARPEVTALDLTADHLGATGTLPLRGGGVLRLVLVRNVDGKRLDTVMPIRVRVAGDEPPWFEELSGVTVCPRTARPGTRVPIAFVARDDMSVSGAALEYVVGPDETKTVVEPIPLTGTGTTRAVGRFDFDLAEKGRAGETLRFRVRITDNRAIADPKLGPQEAVYPPNGWSELKLDATAPPLDEQEITCQHGALRAALTTTHKELKDLAAEIAALRAETAGAAALRDDQKVRLYNAREQLRTTTVRLHDAARDAALAPELRPLATGVRDVADRLRGAEDALRAAETDDPNARGAAFAAAAARFTEADGKLAAVLEQNARSERGRLDRAKLTALAADQAALADAAKTGGAELRARQRDLLARFAALLGESEPLRTATSAARGDEVRRLAAALAELAARLRELDAAAKRTATDARAALVAAVARDQDALGKRATAAFAKLDTAARLAGVALPAPGDLLRVADLAAAGKTVEALTELEKHSQALERIAATFDKFYADRADPKLGAKHLALWQDDLLARLGAAANAGGFDKLPDEAKTALRTEQKALHAAIEALVLPPDEAVKIARDSATAHAARAAECLALDGTGAADAMKLASAALGRVSERTPPVGERLVKSLREVEKVRLELETLGNAVDTILKGPDKPDVLARKLAPHADQLRKRAATIAALDLPGLGARRSRVALAFKSAVSDMQDGTALDVQASVLWARREVDRLKLVLEGHSPPDAKIEELSRKCAALADSLDAHGPALTGPQVEPALPGVREVQDQLARVVAVEAPALLNDARTAIQAAESAFRDAKPDEVRRRVRAAADALGKLNDRLNGTESDYDRVVRLAANRRAVADKPKEFVSSDEAGRQLVREADELAATRVGGAGQALKKRALDLYAKLRAKSDPDRIGSDLKALATTLDELAAKMADVADLTAGFERLGPALPTAADEFLPSKAQANELRDLARRQRAIHAHVTQLADQLAALLRPADPNPFAALEAKQLTIARDAQALAKQLATAPASRAAESAALATDRLVVARVGPAKEAAESAANFFRQLATTGTGKPWGRTADELVARQDKVLHELNELLDSPGAATAQQIARASELARTADEFAELLELVAKSLGPDDELAKVLREAAGQVTDARKALAEAIKKATDSAPADAEKHRAAADALLRAVVEKLTAAAPPPAGPGAATGLALRTAERALRGALDALSANDPAGALKAMRDAAAALQEAAKVAGK